MRKSSLSVIRGIELKITAELTAVQLVALLTQKTHDSKECEDVYTVREVANKFPTKAGNLFTTVERKGG